MAKRKPDRKKEYTCDPGDSVTYLGRLFVVAQIVAEGSEPKCTPKRGLLKAGQKDLITVFPVRDGQVMRRSPKYIHDKWRMAER